MYLVLVFECLEEGYALGPIPERLEESLLGDIVPHLGQLLLLSQHQLLSLTDPVD